MTLPECGRPTKKGAPCRSARAIGQQACAAHLDPEARKAYDAERAAVRQFMDDLFDRHLPAEPACWSWPVGDPVEADDITGPLILDEWQRNRCAVCSHYDVTWVLDHDHTTGLIRGYLCRSCNGMEAHQGGVFSLYRERNPATILGIKARYYSVVTGWAGPGEPAWTDRERWKKNPLIGVGL